MPYPRAYLYVLGVIAVIIVGFWPSYFAVAGNVPWQFHAHGVAASCWVSLVAVQSWTAHRKPQLPLHRAVGMASLFLFPFLIAGLAAITTVQAKNWIERDPVHLLYGPGFMIGTMVAMAAYVTVYYRALKYRRQVWVHAGYMLSTPLILFESPFSRAASFVFPPFMVKGPADFPHIMASIEWSEVLVLMFIAGIWWRVGERARPFLVTAGFVVVEMLAMGFASDFDVLKQFDTFIGHVPALTVVLLGFAIGAATSWAGWEAGKRATARVPGAVQPV